MQFFNSLFKAIVNFFGLTKLLSNVKNIAIVLLAFYLSGVEFNLLTFLLGIGSLSCIFSASYAFNNLSDVKIDEHNSFKKHYSQTVAYFGQKNVFIIIFLLVILGLIMGFFVNAYFLTAVIILLVIGFLYSFKYTRFKEKFILDVLFGATLTYVFRFIAAWFIFSISLPPLLPILLLACAKNAGYLLYKQVDRPALELLHIKNTITLIKTRTLIILSIFFWFISFVSFLLLCLNPVYFKIKELGSLPVTSLVFIPIAIVPLVAVYLYALGKIKTKMRHLRILGFIYYLLSAIIIFILLYK